ncbi:MAG: ABC transporter permease subunit/CPBP intramembrane protease [Candidatus Cloacimonas sp.]|jgi:sodium transport system permease protein|nr:ABC transporter permease subunit/CPBP intramembrane protease [Candidatus Cloacimonas sp.]
MNFKKVGVVYRKELLEVLRDKRTLFTTLILPIILYPLLIIGFNSVMSRQNAVLEEQGATVALVDSVNTEVSLMMAKECAQIEHYNLVPYSASTPTLYENKDIQAIVTIRDSLGSDGLAAYKIYIQYDKSKDRSQKVYRKLSDAFKKSEKKLQSNQLQLSGINSEFLDLVSVRERDTSTAQKKMGMLLGMFLPYIMIMMLVAGASTVASDLVAGEKERKTLETLLVSSIGRQEIVFGKYLTIITLAMVNVVINLFSISFSLRFMMANMGADMGSAQLPVKAIFILIMAMIPLATFFAALLLSISTFSRNMKEARTYEQPIMMVAMMMGMVSFLPAVEMNNLMALIPVVNIALLFKAVMINEYTLAQLFITIGSTILLDVAAIWITIKLFTTESILFRADDDGSSLKAVAKDKRNFFNPFFGIVYFTIALVALYYLGGYFQAKDLMSGLLKTQVYVILIPVLGVLGALKLKGKDILRLKMPKLKELVLIPFIAIPAAIIVSIISQLTNLVFPFPPAYLKLLGKLFTMDSNLWKVFLVMAVTPGICEELLFRGFMMRFFEKNGAKMAVIISALLFAAFHLDPFRFLPVFLLGLLLGYLTVRSGSIINSMLSHTINNGLALFLVTYGSTNWLKPLVSGEDSLQYWLIAPAILIFSGAIYLFHKFTNKGEN